MPCIIDYSAVADHMRSAGRRCLYYNSGAFGFSAGSKTHSAGWIGPPDPTLRPAARSLAHTVGRPYESTLVRLALRAWREQLPGRVWLMPMSHWAYELEFGSTGWMPTLLQRIGLDPRPLQSRTDAAAIEFFPDETALFADFIQNLLENLTRGDFALAFPDYPAFCTLHHHKQLWWTTTDEELAGALGEMASTSLQDRG